MGVLSKFLVGGGGGLRTEGRGGVGSAYNYYRQHAHGHSKINALQDLLCIIIYCNTSHDIMDSYYNWQITTAYAVTRF